MPNNFSATSSEDSRKLDAQKNTCKECAKAGRSPKEACPHKGQDNAPGSEETAGKAAKKLKRLAAVSQKLAHKKQSKNLNLPY